MRNLGKFKILILMLMFMFVLTSLVGCGGNGDEPEKNASSGEATEGETYEWRLAQSKANQHPVSQGCNKFAEIVEEKSNGRIKIDVFNDAVLGNDREVIEGAQTGTLEFASSSTPNMSSFTNLFIAWDLPYIFENKEEVYKAIDGAPGEFVSKAMEESGFKVIFYPDYGFRQIVNNEKEIKVPADIKGLKIRTTNSPVEIEDYMAFGANPTPIAWSEVYTALQQGTVQGEGNSYSLLWDTKHQEVLDYVIENNYNYSSDCVVMNLKIFESLSPEDQELLMEAGREAVQWQRDLANEREAEAKQQFIDFGVKVYEPTPEEYVMWKQATKPVWDKFVVEGEADPDYVDLILETLGKTREDVFK